MLVDVSYRIENENRFNIPKVVRIKTWAATGTGMDASLETVPGRVGIKRLSSQKLDQSFPRVERVLGFTGLGFR